MWLHLRTSVRSVDNSSQCGRRLRRSVLLIKLHDVCRAQRGVWARKRCQGVGVRREDGRTVVAGGATILKAAPHDVAQSGSKSTEHGTSPAVAQVPAESTRRRCRFSSTRDGRLEVHPYRGHLHVLAARGRRDSRWLRGQNGEVRSMGPSWPPKPLATKSSAVVVVEPVAVDVEVAEGVAQARIKGQRHRPGGAPTA